MEGKKGKTGKVKTSVCLPYALIIFRFLRPKCYPQSKKRHHRCKGREEVEEEDERKNKDHLITILAQTL